MADNKLAVEIIEIELDRCANVYGVSPCNASLAADVAAQTVVNPTLNANSTGQGGITRRQYIAAAAFAVVDGNRIQITFTPSTSGGANTTLSNVFVGHAGVSLPDFDGNQTRVTFNDGDSAVTLSGGGSSEVSDVIEFQFDHTKALIVSMDITGTSSTRNNTAAGANFTDYTKSSDSANVGATSVTGYASTANKVVTVDLVEVLTVNTGAAKCFNSKNTCQSVGTFNNDPVTLRFGVSTSDFPDEIECVPSLKDVNFDPATLSLGENLGQRATLTAVFRDHPDSDTGPGGDPYLSDRDYNPWDQGSYWGKFRARHPFVRARALRWITGFVPESFATSYPNGAALPDDVLDDQTTRHFIIDSFTGPTPKAEFTIVAKDVLKLADGDRALLPRPSTGFLSADINSVVTAAALSPAGVGNAEYPASGYINIGNKEICAFTRSADALTITRASRGTVASAHSAQDVVQVCLTWDAADPADIFEYLYATGAGVAAGYIPSADWADETGTFFDQLLTTTIATPTSVNTLLSELIQHGFASWWRDLEETIGLQVLRGIDTSAAVFSEETYIADSLSIQEQPDKRVSQVLLYFAQINPLTSLTDEANYRSLVTLTDDEAETDYGSAAIKKIFSRWIPVGGRSIADRVAALQLARYRDPPRKINFAVLRDSNEVAPQMAQGFRLTGRTIQDDTGATTYVPIEVTRVNPGIDVVAVEAEEMLYTAPVDEGRNVVFDFDVFNVNLRTSHDLLYPTPESGDTVTCTVMAGVTVGSHVLASPALDIGSWPAGVTIVLDIRGTLRGKGGSGAGGANISDINGGNGDGGGTALYTRYALSLKVSTGRIWAGGGGGGGGGSTTTAPGSGGGGGRGLDPGGGGSAGISGFISSFPGQNATSTGRGFGGDGVTDNFGERSGDGGDGGDTGSPGTSGQNSTTGALGGTGGAAGAAIDGISFVTVAEGPGDILGLTVN